MHSLLGVPTQRRKADGVCSSERPRWFSSLERTGGHRDGAASCRTPREDSRAPKSSLWFTNGWEGSSTCGNFCPASSGHRELSSSRDWSSASQQSRSPSVEKDSPVLEPIVREMHQICGRMAQDGRLG